MSEKNCHCDTDLIRKHEELILANKMTLEEFLSRYDRDRAACNERYREDREEARLWRVNFDAKLSNIEQFIAQLKPNYKAALYILGTVTVSALALIFKIIWTHITNGK